MLYERYSRAHGLLDLPTVGHLYSIRCDHYHDPILLIRLLCG